MFPLTFQDLIERHAASTSHALDLAKCRLVRHDANGRRFWGLGARSFEHWASFQKPGSGSPYNECSVVFQFVPLALPGGAQGALFVCAHGVGEKWIYEGTEAARQPRMLERAFFEKHFPEQPGCEAADLTRLTAFDVLSERVVIQWSPTPAGARSWSQWWRQAKPIVELRSRPFEQPFPGFRDLRTTLDEVDTLPPAWAAVLQANRGVYLLVCPDTGEQYVGSATGADGFFGRWAQYAADGHGGNKYMKARGRRHNYRMSILEVASSEMSTAEVIAREWHWMNKLGSRAHGLNHDPAGKPLVS